MVLAGRAVVTIAAATGTSAPPARAAGATVGTLLLGHAVEAGFAFL